MDPVGKLEVEDVSKAVEPMTKRFKVKLASLGTDSCLLVKFSEPERDVTVVHAFGSLTTCKEIYPGISVNETTEIEPELEVEHIYQTPGNYVVSFQAGNHLPDRQQLEIQVTVKQIDCRPPIVQIKNPVNDFRGDMKNNSVWRSRPLQLYAKSFVDCNATNVVVRRFWTAVRLHPKTGRIQEEVDLQDVDSRTKTFLYIQPFTLKPGVYRFTFNVHILSPDNSHPLLPFEEQASTHVQVVRSPIIGQMTDGAQSRIIRGQFCFFYLQTSLLLNSQRSPCLPSSILFHPALLLPMLHSFPPCVDNYFISLQDGDKRSSCLPAITPLILMMLATRTLRSSGSVVELLVRR